MVGAKWSPPRLVYSQIQYKSNPLYHDNRGVKRTIFSLIVVCLLLYPVLAQENMGARPIAMGGAFTGLADDANAIFVNPAGIGYVKAEQATISSKMIKGSEYTILGGVEKTDYGTFGIGYISSGFDVGNTITTGASIDAGNQVSKQVNQTVIFSYARQLNDFMVVPDNMGCFSLGTNLKVSTARLTSINGLSVQQGNGFDLDLAALFKANETLSFGLCLQNILGKQNQPALSAGVSGNFFEKRLIWNVADKNAGIEVKMIPEIALRVGRDGDYNTAGAGINLSGVGIDYGYLAKPSPVQYIGIALAIDAPTRLTQASVVAE